MIVVPSFVTIGVSPGTLPHIQRGILKHDTTWIFALGTTGINEDMEHLNGNMKQWRNYEDEAMITNADDNHEQKLILTDDNMVLYMYSKLVITPSEFLNNATKSWHINSANRSEKCPIQLRWCLLCYVYVCDCMLY